MKRNVEYIFVVSRGIGVHAFAHFIHMFILMVWKQSKSFYNLHEAEMNSKNQKNKKYEKV